MQKQLREYTRYCRICGNYFRTAKKFSSMCDECKMKRLKERMERNLLCPN